MAQALTYAPTPPRDRVGVVWQGDEFEITIPARFTLRGILFLILTGFVSTIGCYLAFNPLSDVKPLARVTSAVVGIAWGCFGIGLFRQCRTWTRLTLRKGRLECSIPSWRGFRVTRYIFSSFSDASVGRSRSKRDNETYLLLHRKSGEIEQVLGNMVCRRADLEIVAHAIREAIARRSSEGD